MMGSPIKLHSFCHLCMSPSPHHHQHTHSEYSRCLDMRPNLEYSARGSSYHPAEGYPQSPFPASPQTMSSCMYSTHNSPSPVIHSLGLRASEQFMSPSKENGLFRDNPQCRRRLDFNHNDYVDLSKAVPVAVAKRNERERNRVKLINTTFQTLRQHLPIQNLGAKGQAKKLSKVQTLRSAIDYIRKLEDLVEEKKEMHGMKKENNDSLKRNNYESEKLSKIGLIDMDSGFDTDKEIKEYSSLSTYPSSVGTSSTDSPFVRFRGISPSHDLPPNGTRSTDDLYLRGQHHSRAFHHHHHHHHHNNNNGRASLPGVAQSVNSPPDKNNKYSSEGGSASSPASDISADDVTATEEDDFFDFDMWF